MIKINNLYFKIGFFHTIFKTNDPGILTIITNIVVGYLKKPVNEP